MAECAKGVYRPRRPRETAFYRLVDDHYTTFAFGNDDRFAREDGPLRAVVPRVVDWTDTGNWAWSEEKVEFETAPSTGTSVARDPERYLRGVREVAAEPRLTPSGPTIG